MTDRDDLGHEPKDPHDEEFAPVTRDSDARGRTVPGKINEPGVSGTGVPGVDTDKSDSLPPTEEGVEKAEREDDSW
ncbi:hypothetical protein [Actinomadura hibisca]|uniref:hypothetical protein n=1 Tax=Actinomadura hibisca TaxID=68565 RepID=UPI00082A8CD8|nr:hypothetical protein [Actinomadura hibisca]